MRLGGERDVCPSFAKVDGGSRRSLHMNSIKLDPDSDFADSGSRPLVAGADVAAAGKIFVEGARAAHAGSFSGLVFSAGAVVSVSQALGRGSGRGRPLAVMVALTRS